MPSEGQSVFAPLVKVWTGARAKLKEFLNATDETNRSKIALAIFDKLVLGALILIVASFLQSKLSANQFRAEMAAKFVEIQDKNLSHSRSEFLKNVGGFLVVLDKLKNVQHPDSPKHVKEMNQKLADTMNTLEEIKIVVGNAELETSIASFTAVMTNSVVEASSSALTGIARSRRLNDYGESLRTSTAGVLHAMNNAILAAAKETADKVY